MLEVKGFSLAFKLSAGGKAYRGAGRVKCPGTQAVGQGGSESIYPGQVGSQSAIRVQVCRQGSPEADNDRHIVPPSYQNILDCGWAYSLVTLFATGGSCVCVDLVTLFAFGGSCVCVSFAIDGRSSTLPLACMQYAWSGKACRLL